MSRRTWFLVLVAVIVVIGGYMAYALWGTHTLLWGGESSATSPAAVRTVQVRRGRLNTMVEATGNLAAERQQTLLFGTGGTVAAVYVEEGDVVSSGTVLAELDTTELELQVRNAEQSLRSQEAALNALKATPAAEDVAAAQAALKQAQATLDKVKAGPREEDLVAAQASLQSAQEAYQHLLSRPDPDEVEQARLKLEQAKNTLWSAQVSRDDVCGKAEHNPALWAQCESAKAQVGNAEVAVKLAELAYKQAQEPPTEDQIAAALAKVRSAEASLARLQESPTEEELAAAEAKVAQAEANLAKLLRGPSDEAVAQAEARVEQARIALQQAQHRLEDARLVAPFDGVVGDIGFDVDEPVGPSGPGIVLVDMRHFYVDVQVNEVEIGKVKVGESVFLTPDAYPDQVLQGEVTYVSPVGKSVQGVVTYRVRVEVEPASLPLKPRMTVTARINTGQEAEGLLVPLLALHSDARGDYVEVLQPNGSVRKVYVKVGNTNNMLVEVEGDLQEGDRVVVPGPGAARGEEEKGQRFPPPFLRPSGGRGIRPGGGR